MRFTNTFSRVAMRPMQQDAGELREHLADELYRWRLEGSRSSEWVRSFWVKLKHLAKLVGETPEEVHRELQEDADRLEDADRTSTKKDKAVNPWAVCTTSVGREDKKKYERCIMDVKKKHKIKKD